MVAIFHAALLITHSIGYVSCNTLYKTIFQNFKDSLKLVCNAKHVGLSVEKAINRYEKHLQLLCNDQNVNPQNRHKKK